MSSGISAHYAVDTALGRIVARTAGRSFDEGLQTARFVIVEKHWLSRDEWLRAD